MYLSGASCIKCVGGEINKEEEKWECECPNDKFYVKRETGTGTCTECKGDKLKVNKFKSGCIEVMFCPQGFTEKDGECFGCEEGEIPSYTKSGQLNCIAGKKEELKWCM